MLLFFCRYRRLWPRHLDYCWMCLCMRTTDSACRGSHLLLEKTQTSRLLWFRRNHQASAVEPSQYNRGTAFRYQQRKTPARFSSTDEYIWPWFTNFRWKGKSTSATDSTNELNAISAADVPQGDNRNRYWHDTSRSRIDFWESIKRFWNCKLSKWCTTVTGKRNSYIHMHHINLQDSQVLS